MTERADCSAVFIKKVFGPSLTSSVAQMAPKNKGRAKAKSKKDEDLPSPKLKPANSINVRHILVPIPAVCQQSEHEHLTMRPYSARSTPRCNRH